MSDQFMGKPMPQAHIDVLRERAAQDGRFGDSHDDMATKGQLAIAGINYAAATIFQEKELDPTVQRPEIGGVFTGWWQWPWDAEWWKPRDRRRNLVKAAALLVAEIERLDRAAMSIGAQVKAALDAATHENGYPHEYGRGAEAVLREIHDWSGIQGFDHDNPQHIADGVYAVSRWRLDNPEAGE